MLKIDHFDQLGVSARFNVVCSDVLILEFDSEPASIKSRLVPHAFHGLPTALQQFNREHKLARLPQSACS